MEIKKLPEDVKLQLRSGINVINVPQCVNELVLNSLDAKSTLIAVRVNLKSYRLQVVDNGSGIKKENLDEVGEFYMTTKCFSLDNYKKNSKYYGFKGEFLASLKTNCKRLLVNTRVENADTYLKTFKNASSEVVVTKDRPSVGTTITVEEFLCNLPVRQKQVNADFDLEAITRNLEYLSVIHPKVSFTLRNDINKKIIFKNSRKETVEEAFINICPEIKSENLGQMKISKGAITVNGLISKKPITSPKFQLLYINKRPITSNEIQKLITQEFLQTIIFDGNNKKENNFAYVCNVRCPYSYVQIVFESGKDAAVFQQPEIIFMYVKKLFTQFFTTENLIKPSTGEENKKRRAPRSNVHLSDMEGIFKSIGVKRKTEVEAINSPKKQAGLEFYDLSKIKIKSPPKKKVDKIKHIKDNTIDNFLNENTSKDISDNNLPSINFDEVNNEVVGKSLIMNKFLEAIENTSVTDKEIESKTAISVAVTIKNQKVIKKTRRKNNLCNLNSPKSKLRLEENEFTFNMFSKRIETIENPGSCFFQENCKNKCVQTTFEANKNDLTKIFSNEKVTNNLFETENEHEKFLKACGDFKLKRVCNNKNYDKYNNAITCTFDSHPKNKNAQNKEFMFKPNDLNFNNIDEIFSNDYLTLSNKILEENLLLGFKNDCGYNLTEFSTNKKQKLDNNYERDYTNIPNEYRKVLDNKNINETGRDNGLFSGKMFNLDLNINKNFNLNEVELKSDYLINVDLPKNCLDPFQLHHENINQNLKKCETENLYKTSGFLLNNTKKQKYLDFDNVQAKKPNFSSPIKRNFVNIEVFDENSLLLKNKVEPEIFLEKFEPNRHAFYNTQLPRIKNHQKNVLFIKKHKSENFYDQQFENGEKNNFFLKTNPDFPKNHSPILENRFSNFVPIKKHKSEEFYDLEDKKQFFLKNFERKQPLFNENKSPLLENRLLNPFSLSRKYKNDSNDENQFFLDNFKKKQILFKKNYHSPLLENCLKTFTHSRIYKNKKHKKHKCSDLFKEKNEFFLKNLENINNSKSETKKYSHMKLNKSEDFYDHQEMYDKNYFEPVHKISSKKLKRHKSEDFSDQQNFIDAEFNFLSKFKKQLSPKNHDTKNFLRRLKNLTPTTKNHKQKKIIKNSRTKLKQTNKRCKSEPKRMNPLDKIKKTKIFKKNKIKKIQDNQVKFRRNKMINFQNNNPYITNKSSRFKNLKNSNKIKINRLKNRKKYLTFKTQKNKTSIEDDEYNDNSTSDGIKGEVDLPIDQQKICFEQTNSADYNKNSTIINEVELNKVIDKTCNKKKALVEVLSNVCIKEARTNKNLAKKEEENTISEEVNNNFVQHENSRKDHTILNPEITVKILESHEPDKKLISNDNRECIQKVAENSIKKSIFVEKSEDEVPEINVGIKSSQLSTKNRVENLFKCEEQKNKHDTEENSNDLIKVENLSINNFTNLNLLINENSLNIVDLRNSEVVPENSQKNNPEEPNDNSVIDEENLNNCKPTQSRFFMKIEKNITEITKPSESFKKDSVSPLKLCDEGSQSHYFNKKPKASNEVINPDQQFNEEKSVLFKKSQILNTTGFLSPENLEEKALGEDKIKLSQKAALIKNENQSLYFKISKSKDENTSKNVEEGDLNTSLQFEDDCSLNMSEIMLNISQAIAKEVEALNITSKNLFSNPSDLQEFLKSPTKTNWEFNTVFDNDVYDARKMFDNKSQNKNINEVLNEKNQKLLEIDGSIKSFQKTYVISDNSCDLFPISIENKDEHLNIAEGLKNDSPKNKVDLNISDVVSSNLFITISQTNKHEQNEWVKNFEKNGTPFYVNTRTGMTMMNSPNTQKEFQLLERIENIPKGFSPIFKPTPVLENSMTSSDKNKLYEALIASHESELDFIKWKSLMKNQSAESFFKRLYEFKNQSSCDIPDVTKQKFTRRNVKSCNMSNGLVFTKVLFDNLIIIGQLDKKFIVTMAKNNTLLILFDQHAVHERVLVESLYKEYCVVLQDGGFTFKSTKLQQNFPIKINNLEEIILKNNEKSFNTIGITYTIADNIVNITEIPTCVWKKGNKQGNEKLAELIHCIFEEVIDVIKISKGPINTPPKIIQNIINSEACRASVMFGDKLEITMCTELIMKLSKCNAPFQCAHGRPTLAPIIELLSNHENVSNPPKLKNLLGKS